MNAGDGRGPGIRRVTTGHDEHGDARLTADDLVEATVYSASGNGFHHLWGADGPLDIGGTVPALDTLAPIPAPGGHRFGIFRLVPKSTGDGPGLHATDTVDLVLVLQGEVTLELDSGERTVLRRGDTLIQNGTSHRWHNHGKDVALLAVIVLGAKVLPDMRSATPTASSGS
jgi:quercetin dioxygenase-like cupin family protein